MSHANACLTAARSAQARQAASSRTAGRCDGPRSGSRSRCRPLKRWADALPRSSARPAWSIGPAARTTARTAPDRRSRRRSSTCAPRSTSARSRSPAGSGCTPRRSTGSSHGYGLPKLVCVDQATGELIRRDKPARYEHATAPVTWSTSTSRSSATSPTAAAGASTAARPASEQSRTATRPATQGPWPPEPGLRLPAQRRRRPLPAGLRRDPRGRERRPPPGSGTAPSPGSPPQGITIERVLTDNGACYRSGKWAEAHGQHRLPAQANPALPAPDQRQSRTVQPAPCSTSGPTPGPTPPNNYAARPCPSGSTSTDHHRAHTALGGQPPASRVTNLSGQYT